ncbi:MAG TPA: DNA-formamidopyrimidine glycosylase family protein [Longimicrobiales bacterium]|nr:DNA-formamidopyrimidine glycosylase family protein [Longimicrobiales bacterium]
MPELPEAKLYLHALAPRVVGQVIEGIRIRSPSLLKTYDPPISTVAGKTVRGLHRVGKRIVFELDGDLFLVIHLMIAGRFQWKDRGAPVPRKLGHAAFDFADGTLLLTEAGTKKRASLHLVRGEAALEALDPGGLEPLDIDLATFRERMGRENHTLKRALTDPHLFSGIGNAHSDEILWRARLSPLQKTRNLDDAAVSALFDAVREELTEWTARLQDEAGDDFPKKVTAFHPAMAMHGRFGEPCPRCGSPVERIRYADHEINYCATCQTEGRRLRDRGISRLLGEDWV